MACRSADFRETRREAPRSRPSGHSWLVAVVVGLRYGQQGAASAPPHACASSARHCTRCDRHPGRYRKKHRPTGGSTAIGSTWHGRCSHLATIEPALTCSASFACDARRRTVSCSVHRPAHAWCSISLAAERLPILLHAAQTGAALSDCVRGLWHDYLVAVRVVSRGSVWPTRLSHTETHGIVWLCTVGGLLCASCCGARGG